MDLLNQILNRQGLNGLGSTESYYIRFTDDIKRDKKHGHSYHFTDADKKDYATLKEILRDFPRFDDDGNELTYNKKFDRWAYKQKGLDAFDLDADSEADAIEKAKDFYYNSVYNTRDMPDYAVVVGQYVGECPEGEQIIVKRIIKEVHA